ncbi:Glyoxalase/bleomycin resistance protein/dioxygenase [Cordyceps fumosorosea ARSEF 2679]|uniref:Glyoxalase/bleomycin resistance protein/dioxygenase n=1 Tax=Cordyceps fumosorosea (strain ARSEF 2679) TaxID=1081104 RepID=A0A168E4J0_CORFA|nr:Glyoxalase/bleomycin resistance protein/dioxygenase [Cordyceps fumosorosea ARSEF 2679]OAA73368.1 Glyoxalase/bleomycin resistance protein/dioxygenase [Cordyceps fumosorosea ARSEF 2679]
MPDVNPLRTVAAISLFTEDLTASKDFYTRVFGASVVFEDDESCSVRFNNVILNLLVASAAGELVGDEFVAKRDAGNRCQLSVWVADVDAEIAQLEKKGVKILLGPKTKPWGKRIASFQDPAGHSWEIAQDV